MRIVRTAQRRFRRHNAARTWVEGEIWSAMAATWREGDVHGSRGARGQSARIPRSASRSSGCGRCSRRPNCCTTCSARRRCSSWPASKILTEDEYLSLYRPRAAEVAEVRWTDTTSRCSTRPATISGRARPARAKPDEDDDIRTYGHIVIDEVQDLTPMQLRMASRRSLNGSMTVVGDIAQATGALAPDDWDDILRAPARQQAVAGDRPQRRLPHPRRRSWTLANKVMMAATPTPACTDQRACRRRAPRVRRTSRLPSSCFADVADATAGARPTTCRAAASPSSAADAMVEQVSAALTDGRHRARSGHPQRASSRAITVVPVSVVKGLELDGVVVVEPAAIVAAEQQGLRALYVALTRSTQRLTIVHAEPLPAAMR